MTANQWGVLVGLLVGGAVGLILWYRLGGPDI